MLACEKLISNSDQKVSFNNDIIFEKTLEKENVETWTRVRILDKNPIQTVQGIDGRQISGFVEEIDSEKGTNKKLCTWIDTAWVLDEQAKEMKSNEFFHEYLVNDLVKKHLSDVPSFSRALLTDAFFSQTKNCSLYFRKVNESAEMEDVLNDMNEHELRSVLLQVFASICLAQHRIQLKHHDLHLGNVLISPMKNTDEKEWIVHLPFGSYKIPLVNLHATIIDYGLASATDPNTNIRYMRIDEDLLTKSDPDEEAEWGVWGADLQGDEGYDVAMFVESMVEQLFTDRPLNIPKLSIIASLQKLVNIDFTERGRPMQRCTIQWKDIFDTLQLEPLKIS